MIQRILLGAAAVALAVPAGGQSADALVAKYLEARGGREKLAAIRSLRMTGKLEMGDVEGSLVIEIKRPASVRSELTVDGQVAVQAYDGKNAWGIPPGGTPQRLPAAMAEDVAARADIDGPLVDSAAKGYQVELVGDRELDDGPAWDLKLTRKDGAVDHYFLDAKSYLLVRTESHRKVQGHELVAETTFEDYGKVGGVLWPHTIESGVQGQDQRQTLDIERIEIDLPLEDARFQMPAEVAPAPTAPPAQRD
jgi:hypothetical protein